MIIQIFSAVFSTIVIHVSMLTRKTKPLFNLAAHCFGIITDNSHSPQSLPEAAGSYFMQNYSNKPCTLVAQCLT